LASNLSCFNSVDNTNIYVSYRLLFPHGIKVRKRKSDRGTLTPKGMSVASQSDDHFLSILF
jgi:hypothetical protein